MKVRRALLAAPALAAALLAAQPLVSGEDAAAPAALDLAEWLRASLPRHPEVSEADIALLELACEEIEDGIWEDPEVRLGQDSRQDRGDQTEVRLRLPLPNPWAIGSTRALQRAGRELARHERTTALVEAYAELKELFIEAAYRREDARILAAHAAELCAELERARPLRERRQLDAAGWLRLEAAAAEARVRAAAATHRADSLAADMAAHAALPQEGIGQFSTEILDRAALCGELPPLETLRGEALAGSPLLDGTAILRRFEAAGAADTRRRMLPAPEFVQASWIRDSEAARDDWIVQVQFSLPVFSYFRERSLANAHAARADAIEAQQRDLIVRTIAQAYRKAGLARALLAEVEAASLPLVEQADTIMASAAPVDPLDRMRLLGFRAQARRDELEARNTLARALLDLETLYGVHAPTAILSQLANDLSIR